MNDKQIPDKEELRQRLSSEQYYVTQEQGTEAPFTGKYHDCKQDGMYTCICCGAELFASEHKYDSGSGWPSFWQPAAEGQVTSHRDTSHGMIREEVVCSSCGSHLGHVFTDGPQPTGLRYCINSASLDLSTAEGSEE